METGKTGNKTSKETGIKTYTTDVSSGQVPFTFLETQKAVKKAVEVSTPLLAISSPDPAATIAWVTETVSNQKQRSFFVWDVVNGLLSATENSNQTYNSFIKYIAANNNDDSNNERESREEALARTTNLPEMLKFLINCPAYTIVFVHNAHLFFQFEPVIQGLWNLRDKFKMKNCSLVLLGPSFSGSIPLELSQDIVCIDEELPTREIITNIVKSQYDSLSRQLKGGFEKPSNEEIEKISSYLTGMSAYTAEQRFALAITRNGMDYRLLAQQKRQAVQTVPGLQYEQWSQKFSDIGGLTEIMSFLTRYMNGVLRPSVFVRIDELEKYIGGAGTDGGGDTSGVSQDALGVVLSTMEDYGMTGMILAGIPGSGKSLISKSLSGEYGIPLISQDIGAARGSLVGLSEKNIRAQMKLIKGMAGSQMGGAFYIATCNRISSLPPELKRRFRLGTWFFDLPTQEELMPIWNINLKRYGLNDEPLIEHSLTGSDVNNICYLAYALKCSVQEARKYVTTVAESDPESIEKLRASSSGKFLSSSYPGTYYEPSEKLLRQNTDRTMTLD